MLKPKAIAIECNAGCQLRCPTCPTTSKGYPPAVGSGHLRLADFTNLLKDSSHVKEVFFENRGEMFLNPELSGLLEYGFRREVPISCKSGVNLNHVGEGVLEGLVKYRFRTLVCSIDGASPETYKTYRVGGDFEQVMEHIRRINHYKKVYQSEYPRLTWQFVVFGHNEAELPRARQRAAELDMEFQAKMSWDADYAPIRNRTFVMEQTGWPAVTREEYEAVTGVSYMRQTCYSLWQYPNINWDGRILGCCWNSWSEFGGNAFEDGYVAAVNTENIRYARDMLLGKAEHRDDLPCSSCKLYLEMRDAGNYLTKAEIYNRWEHRVARIIEYSRERLGLRKAPV